MDPARWVSLPGCDVLLPPGDNPLRLSVVGSGWFQEVNGESRQILCGDVDALIVALLKSQSQRHLALAVSSVIPGLCLGPALSFAVDSLVSMRIHKVDGRSLIRTDERIAIVSRSHSLRDYLAESRLRFGRNLEFPFMSFPTFRMKRSGQNEPAKFGRNGQAQIDLFTASPKFLFYDMSPLQDTTNVPECAVVLAELLETDGPQYVERMMAFAAACHARYVFPIMSEHDVEKRRILEAQNFRLAAVTQGAGVAQPTFAFSSLCEATPAQTRFVVHPCADPIGTALEIDRAYRILRQMWKACGNLPQPRQLRRAWNILDEMTAAPSSIATLETVRRDAPRVTTLGFAIEKLAHLDISGLPSNVQTAITLRWPHLCEILKDIYEMLRRRNPVMETVIDIITNTQEELTVTTRSDTAAEALRRDLLFDWGWKDDGRVTIGSAASLCRERHVGRHIVALGFNPVSRPQIHWAMLPATLEVVAYPHTLTGLAEYQSLVRHNAAVTLPKWNMTTMTALLGVEAVKQTKTPAFELLYADLGPRIAAFAAARREAAALPAERPDDLLDEEEMTLTEMVPSEPLNGTDSEPTSAIDYQDDGPYVVIHLVGGEEYHAHIDALFAALPAASDEMAKLKATELSQGDRIVLLTEEEHRSVYDLIAERTQHLFPMNQRALDLWKSVTDVLRVEYPPDNSLAVEAFCQRLEDEHCARGRQSMRNWLNGRVYAPEAAGDVEIMLRVSGTPRSNEGLAEIVSTELDRYRNFRRTIGRAIVRRTVSRVDGRAGRSRLDEEIDEVLELCEVREVASVDVIDPNAGNG